MWIDYAVTFLSLTVSAISIVNFWRGFKMQQEKNQCEHLRNVEEIQKKIEEIDRIKNKLRELEYEMEINESKKEMYERKKKYLQTKEIELYLNSLTEIIKGLYPKSNPTVSIKLIYKDNAKDSKTNQVVTWYTYPDNKIYTKTTYSIKNNTEFDSIINRNREYFFVSDLNKYRVLNNYCSENDELTKGYNTSVVIPIKKKEKKIENIIGFLCIESKEKFGNTKKNKIIIRIVKSLASDIYIYLALNVIK